MANNGFKELERQEQDRGDQAASRVKNSLNSEVGMFRMIGDMVELFLPRLLNFFVHLAGGKEKQEPNHSDNNNLESRYPNLS